MTTDPLTLYKLIVLYMLDKVKFKLTYSQISGFILEKNTQISSPYSKSSRTFRTRSWSRQTPRWTVPSFPLPRKDAIHFLTLETESVMPSSVTLTPFYPKTPWNQKWSLHHRQILQSDFRWVRGRTDRPRKRNRTGQYQDFCSRGGYGRDHLWELVSEKWTNLQIFNGGADLKRLLFQPLHMFSDLRLIAVPRRLIERLSR